MGMNVAHSNSDSRLDRTLAALADPTRRAILRRLAQGEARVTELAEPFSISLNSVSKHIRLLERAKLIRRRRAGREHLLSLAPSSEALDGAAAWIDGQRALWNACFDRLEEVLDAQETQLRTGLSSGKEGTR